MRWLRLIAVALGCACGDSDGASEVAGDTDGGLDAVDSVESVDSDSVDETRPGEVALDGDGVAEVDVDAVADAEVVDSDSGLDEVDAAEVCSGERIGSRRVQPAGGVVTFNELAFGHWLELHNTMAIDVDVSGWRVEGSVAFTLPEGTFIGPRAQLVIAGAPTVGAMGPWTGTLARTGELTLVSNGGRRMDAMAWTARTPWPDGEVIAKRDPDLPSGFGESWSVAAATPGALSPPLTPHVVLASDATWRHAPAAVAGWNDLGFDDSGWTEAIAPFSRALSGPVEMSATFTADNHFALYLGPADGSELRFVGRDTQGDWMSSETFALTVAPGDHLFAAAWENPGDTGSPQMLLGEVWRDERQVFATEAETLEVQLGPDDANPGGSAEPVVEVGATFVTPVVRGASEAPWGDRLDRAYAASFVWLDSFEPDALTNQHETYALFRSRAPLGSTNSTLQGDAAFLRTPFETVTGMRYVLTGRAEGTVYVDGELVAEAAGAVDVVLAVAPGQHVLAVAARGTLEVALVISAEPEGELDNLATQTIDGAVVISEIMYHPAGAGSEWIELYNRTDAAVDVGGWQLADAVSHVFAPGTTIAPRATLVIADELAAFGRDYPDVPAVALESGGLANDGEQLELYDACGRIIDRVRFTDGGRWPAYADGGGSSLQLRDAFADNDSPEAWVASDESARATWQTITYRGVAEPSSVGPDGRWEEVILGLLDAGEVLVSDVHVIADPDGARRELAPTFDRWRFLGTHRETRIEDGVLHIVATGPTEHMHNHVVATLSEPLANGTTYEISLRAKWVAGDVQLNSRLYFNRLARTTRLPAPAGGGTPGTVTTANVGPTFSGLSHYPTSPRATDTVRVQVIARDPDGVTAATLYASVDDGPFVAYSMSGDPLEATLPAAPNGAVVQLYVEASDARGATATYPHRGSQSRALYRVGDVVQGPLPGLHIVMTPADRERLHRPTELMSNADIGCTVVYGARVFYDVGVRAKGSQRGRPNGSRLGFNVSFDPLDAFRGVLGSVSVDRSEGTGYGQREILLDQVGARMGIASAEYNDLVYLVAPNGQQTGAALLQTARFGDVMLDNQFDDGAEGALFEYELVYAPSTTDSGQPDGLKLPQPDTVDGTELLDLGADPEAYRHVFLIKNNRRDDDYRGLMAFLASFRGPTPRIDRDQWLQGFALAALAGATDNYAAGGSHNAQFYIGADGRALYFLHDMDFFVGDPRADLVATNDLRRLLAAGGLRTFCQALYDLVAVAYNDAYLARWRDHFAALLPGQDFAGRHTFMVQRAAFVTEAIAAAIPEIAFSASAGDGAITGTAWLDVHDITIDGVDYGLTWTDEVRWQIVASLSGRRTVEARDRNGAILTTVAITAP